MTRSRADAGNAAEAFVAGRLERSGWRILDRNWRVRGGELDIVALDGETLVFVEVRVRVGDAHGAAEESIGGAKLATLMRAAEIYVERHRELEERVWRVDLVAVTLGAHGAVARYNHFHDLEAE